MYRPSTTLVKRRFSPHMWNSREVCRVTSLLNILLFCGVHIVSIMDFIRILLFSYRV